MKIYTSYYSKIKHLQENNVIPISISRGNPRWVKVEECMKELAPDWDTLKIGKEGKNKEYYELFTEGISDLSVSDVVKKLEKISNKYGGKDVALLCYEKVEDYCHRHIVADWMNKAGEDVVEYGCVNSYDRLMANQRKYWK